MDNFLKKLAEIQKNVAESHFDLSTLVQLRTEAKKAFDDRIDQLMAEHDVIKKISMPKHYISLWKKRNKDIKIPVSWRYLASAPFIYGMIFPAVIWHIAIECYHQVCFRLYGIPLVNYKEYFHYDRQLLSILNVWQKINCIYCSYINNLIRYSTEIGGRTERYWCPIKYYRRIKHAHSQYPKFIESDNPEQLVNHWKELQDFTDLEKKNEEVS